VQIVRGEPLSLPNIAVQFPDYAAWQRSTEEAWCREHASYWTERLAGCERVRFPDDATVIANAMGGFAAAPLRIGKEMTAGLREWCRLRKTTVVMSVFTIYAALVLRWCKVPDAVFQYMSDCRFSPQIENTIGYFAAPLYLRMQLLAGDG
jgi:hypothetical protein